MNQRHPSIILRSKILFVFIGVLLVSCNSSPSLTIQSSATSTDDEAVNQSTPKPVFTAPNQSSPTPTTPPEWGQILDREEWPIDFDVLMPLEDIEPGEYLAIWNREDYRVDLVTWTGERVPFIQISSDLDLENSDYGLVPLNLQANRSSFISVEFYTWLDTTMFETIFFFIDLNSMGIQALRTGYTEPIFDPGFGNHYLAYQYFMDPNNWYLVDLNDPQVITKKDLNGPFTSDDSVIVKWQNDTEISFSGWRTDLDGNHEVCFGEVENWDPMCETFPFWVGSMSPDGLWVEIRNDDADRPKGITVLQVDCLYLQDLSCRPYWNTEDIYTFGNWFGLVSSWTPDSKSLVFIDAEGVTGGTTDYWLFDIESNEFVRHWTEPGTQQFRIITQKDWHPIWTPDGERFLVIDIDTDRDPENIGYLVLLEDGSRTPIFEGGVVMGVVQIP